MTDSPAPTVARIEARDGTDLTTYSWPLERPEAKVLIVHGLGEHGVRYGHVAAELNGAGVALMTFDQRGHGASPGPRGHAPSFGHLLADLDRVWEEQARSFRSVPRFVVGHSMGGLETLAWAQTREVSVAGLVFSAPWLATHSPTPWWKAVGGRLLSRVLPALPMETGIMSEQLTSDAEMIAAREADPLMHSKISPRLFLDVERWQHRVRRSAGDVKVPSLFIVPEADELADPSVTLEVAEALPAATTTVLRLPGYKHEPFNERGRAEVIRAVRDWIVDRVDQTEEGG